MCITGKVGSCERGLIALILFYAGVVLCLPVPYSEEVAQLYPWWAKRIGVGNVVFHEVLFIVWIFAYGGQYLVRAIFNRGIPARQTALMLAVLALWCGLVSLSAPLLWLDIGRTFRLLLNVLLLLAVVRWARQMNNFPIAALIMGFFVGTVINLDMSFQYPLVVYGEMRLSGQNTPGVAMGLAIHLSAWLFFRTSNRTVQVIALLSTFVFIFSCAISYSRIGWFAGGSGLLIWAYILLLAKPRDPYHVRYLKIMRLFSIPLLITGVAAFLASSTGQEGLHRVSSLSQQKFSQQSESNSIRWAYVTGVAEILARHPLGVGYSGFYDAMLETETYHSGNAAEEESVYEANPHASFLWYANAGGVPGAFLALVLFAMLLNNMRLGLMADLGRAGTILFLLVAPVYLVIGMTVPYIFNSIILIVPAGIAAGWGWSMRERRYFLLHRHSQEING